MFKIGFEERTSLKDQKKGKKTFLYKNKNNKRICFDFKNIIVKNSSNYFRKPKITEEELKYVILTFNLNSSDINFIGCDSNMDIKKIRRRMKSLEIELDYMMKNKPKQANRSRINRIFKLLESLELE